MNVSRGNIKVKANIFNLPTIITCAKNLLCHSFCYAMKAEKIYKAVLPSRKENLKVSLRDIFSSEMIALLKRRRNKNVRIHESGDFYSKTYVEKWFKVMKALPDYSFYAYTKQFANFTTAILKEKPSNFVLIASMEQDKKDYPANNTKKYLKRGYDKVAYISDTDTNCDAQTDKNIKCCVECVKCQDDSTDEIIFRRH